MILPPDLHVAALLGMPLNTAAWLPPPTSDTARGHYPQFVRACRCTHEPGLPLPAGTPRVPTTTCRHNLAVGIHSPRPNGPASPPPINPTTSMPHLEPHRATCKVNRSPEEGQQPMLPSGSPGHLRGMFG